MALLHNALSDETDAFSNFLLVTGEVHNDKVADVLCPVVVGRQAELQALDAALTAALGGAGRLVFMVGEPGIGKSRLAREVASRARREGARVIAGRAVPAGQGTPYRPLTEALLQALRGSPPADDADLRPWWPALSAIVPGLGGPAGQPSAPVDGDAVLGEVVLAAAGDPRAAGEIQAAHDAGLTRAFANRGMACYAEAILAGRAGDAARADELAAAGHRELGAYPVWSDLALMHAAEAALADGWGEPRAWLETARGSFGAHGLDALARRCAERLGWAGLGVTAREAEVLRLIAEGLANKEIAARLYLSPRTVEKHVESLLRKTGARSRTQLLTMAGKTT